MVVAELEMLKLEANSLVKSMTRLAKMQNDCIDSDDWLGYAEASEKHNKMHIEWLAIQDQILELVKTALNEQDN